MWKIYATTTCQWCKRAKEILQERNEPFEYIELVNTNLIKEFQQEFPNAKTVPQIITPDGYKIGGYEALLSMFR